MLEFHGSGCSVLAYLCKKNQYIYIVVRISGRQYLFLHSDTGYQLFKCHIAQILGFNMFKGSAVCQCWGWLKFDYLKIFCSRGCWNEA